MWQELTNTVEINPKLDLCLPEQGEGENLQINRQKMITISKLWAVIQTDYSKWLLSFGWSGKAQGVGMSGGNSCYKGPNAETSSSGRSTKMACETTGWAAMR